MEEYPSPKEALNVDEPRKDSTGTGSEFKDDKDSSSTVSVKSQKATDDYEAIDVEGQKETGIWVHRPGTEVSKTWEPRKGRSRRLDTEIHGEPNESICSGNTSGHGSLNNDSSSTDDNPEEKHRKLSVRKGLRKLSSVFHRSPRDEDRSGSLEEPVKSPQYANVRAANAKEGGVRVILVDSISGTTSEKVLKEGKVNNDGSDSESPGKGGNVKDMAKSLFRQAEKSARSIKYAFSRKGSRKFQSDSLGINERDASVESESSEEPDTPVASSPTTIVGFPVVSEATARASRSNSFKENVKQENVLPTASSDNGNSADKITTARLERIEDDEDDKPAINNDTK